MTSCHLVWVADFHHLDDTQLYTPGPREAGVRSSRFAQFQEVNIGNVWNELKSSKVVSYTVTRDLTVVRSLLCWVCNISLISVPVCPTHVDQPTQDPMERIPPRKQENRRSASGAGHG